jgi:hypothetical protein
VSDTTKVDEDLKRLQLALEALSADLDAIMRRPHFSLQFAAENLTKESSGGIGGAVSNFAAAIKRRQLAER